MKINQGQINYVRPDFFIQSLPVPCPDFSQLAMVFPMYFHSPIDDRRLIVYGVVWVLGWKIEGVFSLFEMIGGSNEFKSISLAPQIPRGS